MDPTRVTLLFLVGAAAFSLQILYLVIKRWRKGTLVIKPPTGPFLYEETFGSGRSWKNFFTRLGGAHNCLRIIVTPEVLWVAPFFPFYLLEQVDLEHMIPLRSIQKVELATLFFRDTVRIHFLNTAGQSWCIELYPRDREAFIKAVGTGRS